MNAVIEVKNLFFGYRPNQNILRDITFDVPKGAFLAVVGPNGVGKSTLLNLICAALKPEAGTVLIDNKKIGSYSSRSLAKKVAVVRQEFVPVFGFSVLETVLMARTPYFSQSGFETRQDMEMVDEALKATDTLELASRPLAQLSGGERQRVFIARAMAQNTDILLLDEPTSHLDFRHQVGIYDLLKQTQLEKGKTIVTVTHDINLASQYADDILLLGPEFRYRVGKTCEVFTADMIEQTFDVRVFSQKIGSETFFLPLGIFAKDRKNIS